MLRFFPTRQVAIEIFGFSVHWYGLLYLLAFLLAYNLVLRLQRYRSLQLTKDDVSALLSWAIIGVIVGGRMGYVLFYEFAYFSKNLTEVFAVWNGGMSSHGGFIGVALALGFAIHKRSIPLLPFLDVITVPIALGLACGRIGNFVNWELYGTVTDVPWAMAIPGVEGLRHPTFFYAFAKNLFIAAVCYRFLRKTPVKPGQTFSVFLLMYGMLRFIVEYYRAQTYALTDLGFMELTRGQLLSLPIIAIVLLCRMCSR